MDSAILRGSGLNPGRWAGIALGLDRVFMLRKGITDIRLLRSEQVNVLVRLVLHPLDRTLTDWEANRLRDLVYCALHRGKVLELSAG